MPHYAIVEERRAIEARFVARAGTVRLAGALACGIAVAAALWCHGHRYGIWIWPALLLNMAIWPWLVWQLGHRAPSPLAMERRLAIFDGIFVGIWIALTGMTPVLSVALGCMLVSGGLAAGHWRSVVVLLVSAVLATMGSWLLAGRPWWPSLPTMAIMIDMGSLVFYVCVLVHVLHSQLRELLRHNAELQRQNRTDASIELPNRRYFESRLKQAHGRYRHYRQVASVLLIDVDHFKAVNDRYGHQAGDRLLTGVAEILRVAVRSGDLPARYGGDEFAVLLINANRLAAEHAAQRICRMLALHTLKDGSGLACTLSIGVAEISMDHVDVQDWVNAADAALYRAKAAGRNQIMVA